MILGHLQYLPTRFKSSFINESLLIFSKTDQARIPNGEEKVPTQLDVTAAHVSTDSESEGGTFKNKLKFSVSNENEYMRLRSAVLY